MMCRITLFLTCIDFCWEDIRERSSGFNGTPFHPDVWLKTDL
ncbi:MAG: hypothetical protein QXL15_03275 [Candidatus Korarchaeota archaeon]